MWSTEQNGTEENKTSCTVLTNNWTNQYTLSFKITPCNRYLENLAPGLFAEYLSPEPAQVFTQLIIYSLSNSLQHDNKATGTKVQWVQHSR